MSDIGTTQPMSEELTRAAGLLTLRKKMMEDGKADSIALLALARKISEVPEATLAQAKEHLGHSQAGGGEGVAEWAKIKYREQAARTLTCSMTTDGKIGSVYFPDGRIRTVHGAGPAKESHTGQKIVQMNVDDKESVKAYMRETGKTAKEFDWDAHDKWLALYLNDRELEGNLPDWAILVEGPDTAETAPDEDYKLFEIFRSINDDVETWHPSRGTAVKFETDKQTISVLENAIKHIAGITGAQARNIAFYKYVTKRLPNFTEYMRNPGG